MLCTTFLNNRKYALHIVNSVPTPENTCEFIRFLNYLKEYKFDESE